MASNHQNNPEKNFKLVVTCPICLNYLKQPKQLPNCSHSLCLECVRELEQKRVGNQDGCCSTHREQNCQQCPGFECPLCRSFNYIGPDGVDAFSTNSIAQQMAEIAEAQDQAADSQLCPHIFEADRELCPHCNCKLCEICRIAHMEGLKVEIADIRRKWTEEFPPDERPHPKLQSILKGSKDASLEQVAFLEDKLETVVQTMEASAVVLLNEKTEEITNQAKCVQDAKLEQVQLALDFIGGEEVAETHRLKSFLQQSDLTSTDLNEAAELHKITADANKTLTKPEFVAAKFKLDVQINQNIDAVLFESISNVNLGILHHNIH